MEESISVRKKRQLYGWIVLGLRRNGIIEENVSVKN